MTERSQAGKRGRIAALRLAGLLWLLLAAGLLVAVAPAWAVSPSVVWASPVHADDEPPFADLTPITGVSCPSTGLCIAVDGAGDILSSTDPTGGTGAWARAASVANRLTGVSCPSAELCVAIGGGSIATSTDPTGGAGAWTVTKVLPIISDYGGDEQLEAVSCASVNLCVVTDDNGDVLTSTDPAGGADAWTTTHVDSRGLGGVSCPSVRLCVATAPEGDVVTSSDPTGGAGAWTETNVDGTGEDNQVEDVSCSSETLCVATDNDRNVLTSIDPTGGAGSWKAIGLTEGRTSIRHLSCIAGLCVGVDGEGVITSTEPTGGASAWTQTPIDLPNEYGGQESIEGVSCPAAGLCVLADSGSAVVTSTEPTAGASAWTVNRLEAGSNALQGVSCASEELCVAVDDAGNVVSSTDPAAAPGTWTNVHVDGNGGLDGVSCPSAGLCVAVDEAGDIVTSTEPAGGAGAWHVADVDGTRAFRGVSCASETLCVAIDSAGDIETSTDPTGGVGAWSFVRLYPGLTGVSCPSEHLCVLTAEEGYIITSTEPAGGAATWSLKHVGANEQISCPSVSLCVTVNSGLVPLVTAGDPTSGVSPWMVSDVKGLNGLDVVSCARTGLCVATSEGGGNGSPGNVAVSSEPAGAAPAWFESNVYGVPLEPPVLGISLGGVEMPGVSCVPEGMCVVVDTYGRVMVGAPPPIVAPVDTSAPVASGTTTPGQTLSCSTGSWTGYPPPTFTYQWLRGGAPIAGADTSAYVVQAGDEGHGVACEVTAINSAGSASATSDALQVPGAEAPHGGSSPGGGSGGGSVGGGGSAGGSQVGLTGIVSNAFVLGGTENLAVRGAVKLRLTVPGPGVLAIVGDASARVAGASRAKKHRGPIVVARLRLTVSKPGPVLVTLTPTPAARAILAERGKLTATVTITYTPRDGAPRSMQRIVTFELKHRH
jgi:hypothetical protein